ncbi:MAG: Holliday junction branch migration protein RuvA [Dehalococcoidales bacterium]
MIASLRGKLESIGGDWVVIGVGGVGYQVYLPTSTLSTLGVVGKEVFLLTHLVTREDSLTLYGFATESELELFQILIGVSGLGPRLGLAVLSAMSVEQVTTAIASENADLLMTVSGIGKKMAQRLILELKDKIAVGLLISPTIQFSDDYADVVAALTSLGYTVAEASQAVTSLPSSELPLEEKIRLALQYFTVK